VSCARFVAGLKAHRAIFSPIAQNAGEIRGTVERCLYMLSIAAQALEDVALKDTDKAGFRRFIRRDPLGVVFVIAPWK
jgi:acyl-CoA reductase-like NAD-dependent aldehyde dehydrogenase